MKQTGMNTIEILQEHNEQKIKIYKVKYHLYTFSISQQENAHPRYCTTEITVKYYNNCYVFISLFVPTYVDK